MSAVDVEKLYELAGDEVENLAEELYKFDHLLHEQYEIKSFLINYLVEKSARKEILDRLSQEASPRFKQLLNLLWEKDLLHEFSWMAEQLISLVEQRKKIKFVEIRTAFPLKSGELEDIVDACGAKVRYNVIVDPELLGGFVIKYADGRVFDGSILGRLGQLRTEMVK